MCHQVDFLSLKFRMRDMNFEREHVEHLQLGGISFILFQRRPLEKTSLHQMSSICRLCNKIAFRAIQHLFKKRRKVCCKKVKTFHFDNIALKMTPSPPTTNRQSPKRQKSNYPTNYLAFWLAFLGVVWSKNLPQSHNLRIYQSVPKVANCFCVYNMLLDFE